jgi:phosphate transport system permease protein
VPRLSTPRAKAETRRPDINRGDRRFYRILQGVGLLVLGLLLAIFLQVLHLARPALDAFGASFLFDTNWDPVAQEFGAAPFLYGTLVSSLIALCLSVPVSVGVSLFLNELAPPRLAKAVGFGVEMLAAIPSVIYGLWGVFVPFLRTYVQPTLGEKLGFLPLFSGPPYGVGMMSAGIILAIMITPTISTICREVFRAIPLSQREAALGLGSTRWEMIRISVLSASAPGILGAVVLGLGRALGETMAVTMVIGNRPEIAVSLFAPGQTLASVIANEYAEATGDLHLSALAAIGLVLFGVSLCINAGARFWVWRLRRALAGGRA